MIPGEWLELSDGRKLCYATWGAADGRPCFLFHGWPGSRLMGSLLHGLCTRRGVRLIAPDRPGFGRSDFQPGRTMTDWPGDVSQLADHLELDRFGVVGISNGGPYALACGAALAHRLEGLAVVSGMGPIGNGDGLGDLAPQVQLTFALNALSPLATELVVWVLAFGARVAPVFMASQMRIAAPPPDRAVLHRAEVFEALKAEYAEAFYQGAEGLNHEIGLMRQSWGFALSDVRPTVHLFHGDQDVNVPPDLAERVASGLPEVEARFVSDAAHYWYVDHFDEVLDALGL